MGQLLRNCRFGRGCADWITVRRLDSDCRKAVGFSVSSRVIAYLTAFACLPAIADARSFNCANARLPDEVLICQSPVLSRLDQRMASIYFALRYRIRGAARRELEAAQSDWLRERMNCGRDYYCIERAYERRIPQLLIW